MKRGIPAKKPMKNYIRKATRISYVDQGDGFVESCPILLGCEIVIIQVDRANKVFRVLDAKTKRLCYMFGGGESLVDCKRKARARLIEHAASILDEVRVNK